MSKIKYRADIDGLRAIAILSVLIFHLDAKYLSGGFVGVDIFFVISGFLITSIIKKEIEETSSFNFKNFYIRRIRRLFPALFVTLAITTIIVAFIFSPTHLSSYGGSLVTSLLSVSNFFFWVESDYFNVSSKVKPLLHTWTLSIEEQFYLIWPITLLFLVKIKRKSRIFILFILTILITLILTYIFKDGQIALINHFFPFAKDLFSDGKSTIFFLLPFRFFEFLFGAILVWFIHYRLSKRFYYDMIFFIGLIFILYSIFFFDENMIFPYYNAIIPTLGTFLVIYSSIHSRFNFVLENKLFIKVGLISYSLYLVHWPVIVIWNYLSDNVTISDNFAILIICLFLAMLSYKYIEQPFRNKTIDMSKKRIKNILISLFLIINIVGLSMYFSNGWTWRVNSIVNFENVGDSKNFHKKFYGGEGYPFSGSINTQNPADIVLIGDSHGGHYLEGIYKVIAKPYNLNLYNSSGTSCITLPNFTRITEGNDWDKVCPRQLNKGLQYLDQGNKNSILIVSAAWISQMSRADLLDENGKRKNVSVNREDILKAIFELKKIIGEKELIIIGQVPGADNNLYDVFTRPNPVFGDNKELEKNFTSNLKEEIKEFNSYLEKASLESEKFIFLNPSDILCKDNICRNLDKTKYLIYSDSSHLSKYGSIEVIEGFKSKILEIINKK